MSEIRNFLQGIDEEYLVGLSNKGILKRSRKDLETEKVVLEEQGEEIHGTIGEVKVILKLPLTDSVCSCPSGSTCKHVIMTILAAKDGMSGDGGQENAGQGGASLREDEKGDANKEEGRQETDGKDVVAGEDKVSRDADASKETGGLEQRSSTAERLLKLSPEEIRKALGAKEWQPVLEQVRTQKPVKIEEGSFVTVLGSDGLTVKLAHPLNYSTCSICHNDKFCRHKAWAALSFLADKGGVRPEELIQGDEDNPDWDGADMAEVVRDARDFLKELLFVGCSRSSPETPYGLERLAIRCHGAGLATMEGKFRALSEQVKGYQERRAGMTAQGILHGLSDLYSLAKETLVAVEQGKMDRQILGVFRTEYQDIPEKTLLGVGVRQFASDTGYQGHTLYFLEEDTGIFYTYTMAMPTIYETRTHNVPARNEVPWGLPCTIAQLSRARILLKQGKANGERRLSSTSQASAELLATGAVLEGGALDFLFDDFEQLWKEYKKRLEKRSDVRQGDSLTGNLPETDRLFLVRPKAILDMHYEEAAQRLVFWLQDFQGRRLRAQLTFSKQEETAIRSLERLAKKVEQGSAEVPIFFGSLYAEDGECTLYPIETLE